MKNFKFELSGSIETLLNDIEKVESGGQTLDVFQISSEEEQLLMTDEISVNRPSPMSMYSEDITNSELILLGMSLPTVRDGAPYTKSYCSLLKQLGSEVLVVPIFKGSGRITLFSKGVSCSISFDKVDVDGYLILNQSRKEGQYNIFCSIHKSSCNPHLNIEEVIFSKSEAYQKRLRNQVDDRSDVHLGIPKAPERSRILMKAMESPSIQPFKINAVYPKGALVEYSGSCYKALKEVSREVPQVSSKWIFNYVI